MWLAVSAKSGSLWNEWHAGGAHAPDGGNEFVWRGIPGGRVEELLLSPEHAVERTAQLTGQKVAALPELIAGPRGPTWSFWRTVTDEPARIRARNTGVEITSRELFVGKFSEVQGGQTRSSTPEVGVASIDQPPGTTISYGSVHGQRNSVFLSRRPDIPWRVTLVDPYAKQR